MRSLGERRHLDRIVGDHWHARLLHVDDPAALAGLIDEARRITGGAVLLLDPRRVTTEQARAAVADLPDARRLPGTTVRVIGVRPRLTEPGTRRVSMVPGFLLLSAAVALGLAVSALLVAGAESTACAQACTDRPADWLSALYWLLSHLLPFEPDGLEAQTWSARWIGVPWSVFNILVLVTGIGLFVQRTVDASRSAGVDLAAQFNTERRAEEEAVVPAVAPAVGPAVASRPSATTVGGMFAAGVAVGAAAAAAALRRRR